MSESIDYRELYEMLTFRRPAGSKTERQFIAQYLDSIPGIRIDGFGNRYVRIGETKTLFSSHTDTVHRSGGKQKIVVDEVSGYVYKDDKHPLGADDATGIFIMRRMLEAEIPGLYVFHRAEEIGGQGSDFIRAETPELLHGIERAIAFDRKASHSVITHQIGDRCCSESFARALSVQIDGYFPDETGVFTDTANYVDIVPECTNLSVGYSNEHTNDEVQCLATLDKLIPQLLTIDYDALPTVRDPDAYQTVLSTSMVDPVFESYADAREFIDWHPNDAAELLWRAYRDTFRYGRYR